MVEFSNKQGNSIKSGALERHHGKIMTFRIQCHCARLGTAWCRVPENGPLERWYTTGFGVSRGAVVRELMFQLAWLALENISPLAHVWLRVGLERK